MEELFDAVNGNNTQKLLEFIKGIDDLDKPEEKSGNFDTLLCAAIREGKRETADMLLRLGASPNGCAQTVQPPLSIACDKHAFSLVKFLLKNDVNVNYVSENVDPPLITLNMWPSLYDVLVRNITKLFLKANADVDIRTKKTRTVFVRCVVSDKKRGSRPTFKEYSTSGSTALMHASSQGRLHVVKMLLQAGADPNLTDSRGNTALHYAALCCSSKYAATGGGQYQLANHTGNSFPDVVELLISKGVRVDAVNTMNQTALDLSFLHLDLLIENHQLHSHYKVNNIATDYFKTISLLIGTSHCLQQQFKFVKIRSWEISIYFWFTDIFFKTYSGDMWQKQLSDTELKNLRDAYQRVMKVTALSGVKITPDDVVMISEIIPECFSDEFKSTIDWLTDISQNCWSLKQLCVIKVRQVLRSPLAITVNSEEIDLPKRFQHYILLDDVPPS